MNLVIVESPAKAKTINKYLGKDFEVMASYGHVRDLIPKEGAVDPDSGFKMKYQIIERNDKHVQSIGRALKKSDALYLATDPDREGEAISWHLHELLSEKNLLENKKVYRVVFNEITKGAIQGAMANPRDLSMDLINAQQTRRALDYLVGFNLSPLLWKKIRRGLSAGRVQSPALRMVVERELEIEAFVSKEYWTIEADLEHKQQGFEAKLTQFHNEKIQQFTIVDEKRAKEVQQQLLEQAGGRVKVEQIEKKQRKRNPAPPFTTSTLQQEASRKLAFGAQRTMRTAQQLYEGIDIGGETVGLITYMRTDSVNLADEAIAEIRAYIAENFGLDAVPSQPRHFKTKAKNAQEAHEAIRPTSVTRPPKELRNHLNKDQLRLYELIWKRALACQMIHATLSVVKIDLSAGVGNLFHATGSTLTSPGFIQLYQEGVDDAKKNDDDGRMLPSMKVGEWVNLLAIRPEQHFTEPPPRYTEASLVKALEEFGIGRPSTYASIITTLQDRDYAILEKKRFQPTDVGRIVNKFLTSYFTQYVDYDFTAKLEDDLDAISRGEQDWIGLLTKFWSPFKEQITHTEKNVDRKDITQEQIDENCPECGKPLAIRLGKHGRFIGCTAYPDCGYTRNLDSNEDKEQEISEVIENRQCPECGSELLVKQGRYGKFIGCSGYPKCRHIEPLEKPQDTGVPCPQCKAGTLLKRKSRRGKIFYSCSTYPKCDYAIWNEPILELCPKCHWPILTIKTTKRNGTQKVCPQKGCDFAEKAGE
jgi:DNA topoisomerase-1